MAALRVGVAGIGGRMGVMIALDVLNRPETSLSAGSARPGSANEGKDLSAFVGGDPLNVTATSDPAKLLADSDVVIDFTLPAQTIALAERSAAGPAVPLVIGTTGLSADEEAALSAAAQSVPIVFAPNMSLGVTILNALVEQVAATLGDDYDIEIVEMHHGRKIDAPSGTAVGLGRAAARGRGGNLDNMAVWSREGHTGARETGKIGFATLRGGDVVGEHTVIFAGPGERVEIGHKAAGRHIFAGGAVRAALWLAGRKPGLYTMRDVLGLS